MSGDVPATVISILWRSERLESSELCNVASISPAGTRLSGLHLAAIERLPAHLVWEVDVDADWRTRGVRVTAFVGSGPGRSLSLWSDGSGHWQSGDGPLSHLDGCVDVDMEWTPATNTLPIRRLGLDLGARAAVAAAWIRLPELRLERLDQSYERLGERLWRYRAGSFEAELEVDAGGLVLAYRHRGDDLWRAVAHSEPGELAAQAGATG